MAYGALKFLFENGLTHDMITASSQASGRKSGTAKNGTGVASMTLTGTFAGAFDLSYELEIDSVSGGTSVGEATFKWRTSNSGTGVWEETGVLTRTSPAYALSADGLGGGLSIAHTGGVGDDFALGDSWSWEARATYGPERLLDLNRMTTWRSTGSTSESLVIDHEAATQVNALVIMDHNLTDAATVTLERNATNVWTSPSYTSTFSTIEDPLVLYFDNTYEFSRITFADATNSDGYIEIASLYMGDYLQLIKVNAEWGSSQTLGAALQTNTSEAEVMRRYYYASQQKLTLGMGTTLSNNDVASILGIQTALVNQTTHRVNPMFVHLFSDQNETMKLMDWINLGNWKRDFFAYLLNSGTIFDLAEVVKV